jgi:hypothetical protein
MRKALTDNLLLLLTQEGVEVAQKRILLASLEAISLTSSLPATTTSRQLISLEALVTQAQAFKRFTWKYLLNEALRTIGISVWASMSQVIKMTTMKKMMETPNKTMSPMKTRTLLTRMRAKVALCPSQYRLSKVLAVPIIFPLFHLRKSAEENPKTTCSLNRESKRMLPSCRQDLITRGASGLLQHLAA